MHKPALVFPAGELRQYTRAKLGHFIFTLHHHTSTDKQLIQLWHAVKSNVVTRDEALSLIPKIDFVLQPTIVCKEQKKTKKKTVLMSKALFG